MLISTDEIQNVIRVVANQLTTAVYAVYSNRTYIRPSGRIRPSDPLGHEWPSRMQVPANDVDVTISTPEIQWDHPMGSSRRKCMRRHNHDILRDMKHASVDHHRELMGQLIENNRGLVFHMIRVTPVDMRSRGLTTDDLEREGERGIMSAADSWDEQKGRFTTWAAVWIKRNLRSAGSDLIKTPRKQKRMSCHSDRDTNFLAQVQDRDHENVAERAVGPAVLMIKQLDLDSRDEDIVIRYLQGENRAKIGRSLGLTRERVRQITSRVSRQVQELALVPN